MSWRDHVRAPLRAMAAYHVPPSTCAIKLDANESPYPPSERLQRAIADAVRDLPLHRYPDAAATALRGALARRLGVDPGALVLGNGSDELIATLCGAFAEPSEGRPARLLTPAPSFVMFKQEAVSHGLGYVEAPLGPRFEPDVDALLAAIARERPALVFVATPNNPTGTVWPRAAIERVLAGSGDAIVVVDEAYQAYGEQPSCVDLVATHERCLVMGTLSKIGLAGLRVGYLVAQPAIVAELEKVRPPYNLDQLAQAAAVAALAHADELDAHAAAVRAERARLGAGLAARGFEVFPSGANLVLCRHPRAAELADALRAQHGIAVKSFARSPGPLAGCLRVTVGTPAEDDALLAALAALG
jgi:histidinol-phosphate aminotransferase